jgi:hypothetical protein
MYKIGDTVQINKKWRWSPTSLKCIEMYDGKSFTIGCKGTYKREMFRKGYYYIIHLNESDRITGQSYSFEIHELELISISEIRNNKLEQLI